MKGEMHSYPKVYSLGHAAIGRLLDGPVIVEEKIDGSQFSFTRIGRDIFCRSRNQAIVNNAAGMFDEGVKTAFNLGPSLHEGWVYRGEYLKKPKHNVLAYDRVPKAHSILFDIETGNQTYLTREQQEEEAARLGLEIVPIIAREMPSMDALKSILDRVSCLGGQKIEGVVIKNYTRFDLDGKVLMGKFVSEGFREKHKIDWKDRNPTHGDVIEVIAQSLRTPARWEKAIQHLKEDGRYQNSMRDIGNIIKEVQRDIVEECTQEISSALVKHAMPQIQRTVVRGLPEWFKERLAQEQFKTLAKQ